MSLPQKMREGEAPKGATAWSPPPPFGFDGARSNRERVAFRRFTAAFCVPGTVTSVCATEDCALLHPAAFAAFIATRAAIQGSSP